MIVLAERGGAGEKAVALADRGVCSRNPTRDRSLTIDLTIYPKPLSRCYDQKSRITVSEPIWRSARPSI